MTQITIPLPPPIARHLDLLRRMGLYGDTVEDVARYLVTRGIHDLIVAKILPLVCPPEGEAEVAAPVQSAEPVADWLTDERLEIVRRELANGVTWDRALRRLEIPVSERPSLGSFKQRLIKLGLKAKVSDKQRAHLAAMRARNPLLHPELRRETTPAVTKAPIQEAGDALASVAPEPVKPPTLADIVRPRAPQKSPEPKPPVQPLPTPAAARSVVSALALVGGAPVAATRDAITKWAEAHGIWTFDLVRINALRRRFQEPPFRLDGEDRLSVATRMEADDRAAHEDCPITLDDALEWGRRYGLKETDDLTADFRAVNEIRHANHLPPYRLIAPRGPLGKLPRADLDLDGLTGQRT
jgi:hypothetical protein